MKVLALILLAHCATAVNIHCSPHRVEILADPFQTFTSYRGKLATDGHDLAFACAATRECFYATDGGRVTRMRTGGTTSTEIPAVEPLTNKRRLFTQRMLRSIKELETKKGALTRFIGRMDALYDETESAHLTRLTADLTLVQFDLSHNHDALCTAMSE
jgi:hypothetical protein